MSRDMMLWYDDADASVWIEMLDGQPFLHVTTKRWSAGVKVKFEQLFEQLKRELKEQGFTWLFAYNTKQDERWVKFVTSFGFIKAFKHNKLDVYAIGV
jgi:hypothetical protein